MTDDERFGMIVSVIGSNILIPKRDPRIPEGTAMSEAIRVLCRVWACRRCSVRTPDLASPIPVTGRMA